MDYSEIIELVKSTKAIVLDDALREDVKMKGAADFVTAVDTKISDYIKNKLAVLTPEIGFMSEEEDYILEDDRWILDPIDGTTNLVYGYNMSSVSLAHYSRGKILFGVVYNPFNGDTFVAERGKGAYLNGALLPKVQDRELADCLIEFGAGSTHKEEAEKTFEIGKRVFENCLDLRRICSSALAISYIAAGRLNGYFEKAIKPWDYAAAHLILEECGGASYDWSGAPIQFDRATSYVCGTKKAVEFMLKTIKEFY